MKTIHQKIKQLRTDKGLSMEELGALIGVTWQTVQQWENGKTAPSRKRLEKVAEALGVTIFDLLQDGLCLVSERRSAHPSAQREPKDGELSEFVMGLARRIEKLDAQGKIRILSTLLDIEQPENRDQQSAEIASLMKTFTLQ